MRRITGTPSISRRVFFTVVLAFVVVLVALQAYMLIEFRRSLAVDQGLSRLGRAVSQSLVDVEDPAQARAVMLSVDTIYKSLRISGNPPWSLRVQLFDAQGRRIYSSMALGEQVIDGPRAKVANQTIDQQPYWVFRSDTPRWSVRVAEPERTFERVLRNNTRVVLPYVLIALPLVLLPVFLAVKLGLRPLQRLADEVAQRGRGDLSALATRPAHAELLPLAQAIDRMLSQLREQVERERAFVQEAAHELRTPMAVIAAQAHALARADDAGDRLQAQAQLEHAIARASHLTQQLLALATLDDARAGQLHETDVAQLTRQVLAQAAPHAFERRIDLDFDAPDSLLACIDVAAFQSIVENLVHNAIRYAGEGAAVSIRLARSDAALVLTVADDGPGLAASDGDRVFERFYRGSGHDLAGSGLGLAIVRQGAVRSGGKVERVAGLSGRGVGFRVTLPMATGSH